MKQCNRKVKQLDSYKVYAKLILSYAATVVIHPLCSSLYLLYVLCYPALLKKFTYYVYINAQYLPIMLNAYASVYMLC